MRKIGSHNVCSGGPGKALRIGAFAKPSEGSAQLVITLQTSSNY